MHARGNQQSMTAGEVAGSYEESDGMLGCREISGGRRRRRRKSKSGRESTPACVAIVPRHGTRAAGEKRRRMRASRNQGSRSSSAPCARGARRVVPNRQNLAGDDARRRTSMRPPRPVCCRRGQHAPAPIAAIAPAVALEMESCVLSRRGDES